MPQPWSPSARGSTGSWRTTRSNRCEERVPVYRIGSVTIVLIAAGATLAAAVVWWTARRK
ncbi:MAG TPA: hypothetical protein VJA44_07805 [Acidimicrobiia bacterium]|nr:hypothetical protein [Acidimicrobiia bacterium]